MFEQKNVIGIREEFIPEETEYTYMAYKFNTKEDAEQFFSRYPETNNLNYYVVKRDGSLYTTEEVENEAIVLDFDLSQLYLNEWLVFNYQRIVCNECKKADYTFVFIYTLDNKYLVEHQKEMQLVDLGE